jgi:peptidoglycan/xylan/chitin deacetylase (PgdA/CDA1 family)
MILGRYVFLWVMMCGVLFGEVERGVGDEDDGVRVSVLGYHDFSQTEAETAMRIRTSKFRGQMEALRELGLAVIPMSDFVAWKKGEKEIPKKSVVITLDDGWKSVYTDAFPILKEFGYPFTMYLYEDYVDGGGKALTTGMIEEMLAHGGTIGCHSKSHPYPQTVRNQQKRGEESYVKFLEEEMGGSKRFLEKKFKQEVLTYAYPGGFFTDEMLVKAGEVGYTHLFTVQPGKVKRDLPDNVLPRYVILGNYDKIFEFATTFRDSGAEVASGGGILVKETKYPVIPMPGTMVQGRMPEVVVDFSKAEDVDVKTLKMQVAGFGEVPAEYDAEKGKYVWQVNRRLREKVCTVQVSWKDKAGKVVEEPMKWSFEVDLEAGYLPDE